MIVVFGQQTNSAQVARSASLNLAIFLKDLDSFDLLVCGVSLINTTSKTSYIVFWKELFEKCDWSSHETLCQLTSAGLLELNESQPVMIFLGNLEFCSSPHKS